jgi:hypothetical protein
MALIMSVAAGMSAEQGRWVSFDEIQEVKACLAPFDCVLVDPLGYAQEGPQHR